MLFFLPCLVLFILDVTLKLLLVVEFLSAQSLAGWVPSTYFHPKAALLRSGLKGREGLFNNDGHETKMYFFYSQSVWNFDFQLNT